MHIHGTTYVHGPHNVNAPHGVHRTSHTQQTGSTAAVDRLEISAAADAAAQAAETGGIRHALVNHLRAQIANGTYDTPAKLDAALERMFDELA